MTTFRESREFVRGAAGEKRVAAWLQERGWYVIPSYDYAGSDGEKAPKLQGFHVGHPIPDLDVCRDGTRRWVEVKTKWEAAWYRMKREYRHGINFRLLQHYQTVEMISGTECWIAVYEESTGALLARSLKELGEPDLGTDRGTRMAYWPRDRFMLLHTFNAAAGAPDGG